MFSPTHKGRRRFPLVKADSVGSPGYDSHGSFNFNVTAKPFTSTLYHTGSENSDPQTSSPQLQRARTLDYQKRSSMSTSSRFKARSLDLGLAPRTHTAIHASLPDSPSRISSSRLPSQDSFSSSAASRKNSDASLCSEGSASGQAGQERQTVHGIFGDTYGQTTVPDKDSKKILYRDSRSIRTPRSASSVISGDTPGSTDLSRMGKVSGLNTHSALPDSEPSKFLDSSGVIRSGSRSAFKPYTATSPQQKVTLAHDISPHHGLNVPGPEATSSSLSPRRGSQRVTTRSLSDRPRMNISTNADKMRTSAEDPGGSVSRIQLIEKPRGLPSENLGLSYGRHSLRERHSQNNSKESLVEAHSPRISRPFVPSAAKSRELKETSLSKSGTETVGAREVVVTGDDKITKDTRAERMARYKQDRRKELTSLAASRVKKIERAATIDVPLPEDIPASYMRYSGQNNQKERITSPSKVMTQPRTSNNANATSEYTLNANVKSKKKKVPTATLR